MGDRMPPTLDLFAMVSGLLGGLAFLLFGMERMADSLKQVTGERMRRVLVRLTGTRLSSLLTGALVTAVIQSSSVTTVLVVGFVSAGVMSLPQSLGIILGADIGTTITAQIIAFNVTRYGLLLVAAGFGLTFLVRRHGGLRLYGALLMGIGLVFYGMGLMSEAMNPLRAHPFFIQLMETIQNPLLAVALGAVFTALVHASAATIGLTIVLAAQGLISLETGIALSLGANIGTCVTAALAAIGKPRPAIQAALAHVLFKVAGTLLVLPFIPQLAQVVTWITPSGNPTTESPALASVVPRQIANAHTLFNVGLAVLFLPLTGPFARLLERLVPHSVEEREEERGEPRYLDPSLLQVPSLALGQVRLEAGHMGKLLLRMLDEGLLSIYAVDLEHMERVRQIDDSVDRLYTHMADYLARMSRNEMSEPLSKAVLKAMSAIGNLESIGDIIETNLHHLVDHAAASGVSIDEAGIHAIDRFSYMARESLHLAVDSFSRNDLSLAQKVYALEEPLNHLDQEYKAYHLAQMRDADDARRASLTLEMSVVEYLKRIYFHCHRTAERVLESVAGAST